MKYLFTWRFISSIFYLIFTSLKILARIKSLEDWKELNLLAYLVIKTYYSW